MSRKYDFISMLDLDSGLEKKCTMIESDIVVMEKKLPEAKRSAESLNEKIFEAHEDYRKSQVVCDTANVISERREIYSRMLQHKAELVGSICRKIENRRSELSVLLQKPKVVATEILNRTLIEVQALYVCETPAVRLGVGDRILNQVMTDIRSGRKTLMCRTNGTVIRESKTALISALAKVNQSLSLTEFKKVLLDLSKELNSKNFEAEELTVDANDFEDLSRRFPSEVGFYLTPGKSPIMLKETVKESRQSFNSDGSLRGNPW